MKSILGLILLFSAGPALCQQPVPAAGQDPLKSALLRPNGYTGVLRCRQDALVNFGMLFREDAGKVLVRITSANANCDREVHVSATGVTFNGCSGAPFELAFQASNEKEPFAGMGAGGVCKVWLSPK